MALPNQLKAARMTDSTLGKDIDDNVGDLEQALCDILGFTIDTNITESPLSCDNSGRITKALLRLAAAAPCGIRFRDTAGGKEFRLAINGTSILVDENTGTEGAPTWANRLTVALGTGLVTMGTATQPSGVNDLTRKAYVDGLDSANVKKTGAQSIDGVKTFTSIPVLPASDPTTDNQAARKKYVDDKVSGDSTPVVILQHYTAAGSHGGGQTAASGWVTRSINREACDTGSICTLSANQFTIPAGTYEIECDVVFYATWSSRIRLYNVSDAGVQDNVNGHDIISNNGYSNDDVTPVRLNDRFTIAGTKTLRIESAVGHDNTTSGWGAAVNWVVEERYLQLVLRKVA